jgi:glycerol uptake facilitator-like aquaporin
MVYAITQASGAHMNPAVTVAVYACGGMRGRRLFGLPASVCTLLYLVVQFGGALAAAAAATHLMHDRDDVTLTLPRAPAGVNLTQQLWVLAVLAFAYVLVFLNVSCRRPRQVHARDRVWDRIAYHQ